MVLMQFHLESWRNELLSLHHHNNTNASENLPMLFQSINLVNALWLKIIDQFPWQVCWRSLWSVLSINISWSSWLIIFCWVRASMLLEKLVHESLKFFSCYTHGSVLSRKVIHSMWSSWILQKPSTGSLIITYFISCNVMAIAFGCFPGSWLSVRPYTKSHYWRLFIRLDGGVLRCSSREYTGATSFPPVHKLLSPKC